MRSLEEGAFLGRMRGRPVECCLMCGGLGACSLCVPSVFGGLSALVFAIGAAAWARVPMRSYLAILLGASGFAVAGMLPLSVAAKFDGGWGIGFDVDGFRQGLEAGTRAVGTLSATLLLAGTTPMPRLASLLARIGVPRVLVDLLALVHRQIHLTVTTFSRLADGIACRGCGTDVRSTMRALAAGISALFVATLRRAERQEQGLASRGGPHADFLLLEEPLRPSIPAVAAACAVPACAAILAVWGRIRLGI